MRQIEIEAELRVGDSPTTLFPFLLAVATVIGVHFIQVIFDLLINSLEIVQVGEISSEHYDILTLLKYRGVAILVAGIPEQTVLALATIYLSVLSFLNLDFLHLAVDDAFVLGAKKSLLQGLWLCRPHVTEQKK